MQISNKGRGVIISLLNGRFWYNSAFAFVPGLCLTKETRSDLNSCASQLYPPCSHSPGAADLQRTCLCILKWELLFGYVILKDPISLGIYCTPFGAEVWARGKLARVSHRPCTEMARGCLVTLCKIWWSAGCRARGVSYCILYIYIGGFPEHKCFSCGARVVNTVVFCPSPRAHGADPVV